MVAYVKIDVQNKDEGKGWGKIRVMEHNRDIGGKITK